MGMFDTFIAKAKCPKCGAEISDFQSKDTKCLLENFELGKRTAYYALKLGTKEEEKEDKEKWKKMKLKLSWKPWGKIFGCFRKTRKIINYIPDGEYEIHNICPNCKAWITGIAVIKNRKFKKIKNIKYEKDFK